jgi:hypothetical protein
MGINLVFDVQIKEGGGGNISILVTSLFTTTHKTYDTKNYVNAEE